VNREEALMAIAERQQPFDIIVIGGGATGAGIALDGASRGLDVLLLERHDFGAGTSGRSTKIIHGGVRYLAQGRIGLVREALHERSHLLQNAPHLVTPLGFVVPVENFLQRAKYYAGLNVYDFLAGAERIGRCRWLSSSALRTEMKGIAEGKFNGAMRYFDARFDDTRLLLNILDTAVVAGAVVVNYADVVALDKDLHGQLRAVAFKDAASGRTHEVTATAIINATGAAADEILKLDDGAHRNIILPSQGSHIVVSRQFLPGNDALLMPQTPDGRIMFAVPWLEHVLIGTTDTAVHGGVEHPLPQEEEIDMILAVAGRYLRRQPRRADVLSVFAGVRPLLQVPSATSTATVSREHRIDITHSGLINVAGGKWTTYRLMAEQCVDAAVRRNNWQVPASSTRTLKMSSSGVAATDRFPAYGTYADRIVAIETEQPESAARLCAELPYTQSQCVWAIRHEMARSIDDILARRTRVLFLNARAAIAAAPTVMQILRAELQIDAQAAKQQLDEFNQLAGDYVCAHG
jgi:glycerol-3-phosphate dehydrogenase